MRKRFLLVLLGGFAIGGLIIFSSERRQGWQPLPSGGKARLLTFTQGGDQWLELPGVSFTERVRISWKERSLTPFTTPEKQSLWSEAPGRVILWFQGRDMPRGGFNHATGRLVLPDGQFFRANRSYSHIRRTSTSKTDAYQSFAFPVLPTDLKSLHFEVELDGATFRDGHNNFFQLLSAHENHG